MGGAPSSAYISRDRRICPPETPRTPRYSQPSALIPYPVHPTRTMAQIVIIDDHDSMREGLELLLRRRGHRTLAAESGARGMELLEEDGADLVITDLKMAKMDGMEVLRSVRERYPHTEVLVITGYGTIEKAVDAMKLGAVDFMTKPFSPRSSA